jgi:glutathione S-transferase
MVPKTITCGISTSIQIGCVPRGKRGPRAGVSETQIAEALERALAALEERLGDRRMYLAYGFSLADIAHAGNFVRLRELS